MTERGNDKFRNNTHLIGDKAYPCLEKLLTPFKDGHLIPNQRRYNYHHASAPSSIERAFALLKKRFRILKFLDVRCIEWACKYIMVCCILHNICILQEDVMDIVIHNDENELEMDDHHYGNLQERQMRVQGQNKRNLICQQF